jgi:hypothetical protein
LYSASFKPGGQILALTDVKGVQLSAAIGHGFDTRPSDSNTAAHRKSPEMKKVKANAA